MDLNLVGLNHKTAPIEIREKFVFSHDMLSHVLKDLKLKTGAEALILSTCNRTEIYFQVKDPNEIYQWLATFNKIKFTSLKNISTHSQIKIVMFMPVKLLQDWIVC